MTRVLLLLLAVAALYVTFHRRAADIPARWIEEDDGEVSWA